jgi:hypothetical protein
LLGRMIELRVGAVDEIVAEGLDHRGGDEAIQD